MGLYDTDQAGEEHPSNPPSHFGFDVTERFMGGPLSDNGRRFSYIESPWIQILPNYEVRSKTQPILPAFSFDKEKTIYVLVMTNIPIPDALVQADIDVYCGSPKITLRSKSEGRDVVLFAGPVNQQVVSDMAKYPVKLIQMTGIADMTTLFEQSQDRLYHALAGARSEYNREMDSAGYYGRSPLHAKSSGFSSMTTPLLKSGVISYPLLQVINQEKSVEHVDANALRTVCTADQSRAHQLPLAIKGLTRHDMAVTRLEGNDRSEGGNRLSSAFSRFFWPSGLDKTTDEDTIRLPSL